MEGFRGGVSSPFCHFDSGFMLIPLSHQALKKHGDHAFPVQLASEQGSCGGLVNIVTLPWRGRLGRIYPGRVADVVTDHDGGVHALEVEHSNPGVQTSLDFMNVTSCNLSFFRFGRPGQRHGDFLCISKANDKGIDQLARAAVGGRFKGNFGHCSHRFFAPNSLNRSKDVEGKFSVSYAIGQDLIWTVGPFLVHV